MEQYSCRQLNCSRFSVCIALGCIFEVAQSGVLPDPIGLEVRPTVPYFQLSVFRVPPFNLALCTFSQSYFKVYLTCLTSGIMPLLKF